MGNNMTIYCKCGERMKFRGLLAYRELFFQCPKCMYKKIASHSLFKEVSQYSRYHQKLFFNKYQYYFETGNIPYSKAVWEAMCVLEERDGVACDEFKVKI